MRDEDARASRTTPVGGERPLRILLMAMGIVMVVAGSGSVLFGASSVLGAGDFSAAVDNEMRFYAVWYVVSGAVLLRAARDIASATWTIRLIAAAFFVAGCGRIASWIAVGRPHTLQIILMVIEVVLPFIVIPWQGSVVRRRA